MKSLKPSANNTPRALTSADAPLRIVLVGGVDQSIRLALREAVATRRGAWLVETYSTPDDALRAVKHFPPDVILLDDPAAHPESRHSAGELVSLFAKSPTVVLAKRAEPSLVADCMMAGASGYLVKPLTPCYLVSAIGSVVQKKPALCQSAEQALLAWLRGLAANPWFQTLTGRERQVVAMWLQGLSVKEISSKLGIAEGTVNAHKANLRRELHIHSRKELIATFIPRSQKNA